MRSVVLSVIEGKNFILGTFDTTDFKVWWKSEPFPGDVETIYEPIHVYGQYHACIVKMIDGTYSIYRTKDMGKSWVNVYNTPDIIYTLFSIDYGWVIGSTSTGWIESKTDSGYTWTKISSFASGCKTVINIDDDILFAHDGMSVWKSEDFAHTWKKILSASSWYSKSYYYDQGSKYYYYDGVSAPALAGINTCILVGFGPYLVLSDDLGENWHVHWACWYDRGHRTTYGLTPPFGPLHANPRILQLTITGSDINPQKCSAIARVHIIDEGIVELWYTGLETVDRYTGTTGPNERSMFCHTWDLLYSYKYRNDINGYINSIDVLKPGSTEKELLTTFTTYNSSNTPIVKYSIDRGYTWNKLDASTVSVYEGDPSQEIVSGLGQQVFDEEYHTTYKLVAANCHNYGHWKINLNNTVRGISADMDFLIKFRKATTDSRPNLFNIIIAKLFYKNITADIVSKKAFNATIPLDMVIKKLDKDKTFLVGGYYQMPFIKTHDIDIATASRLTSPLNIDIPILKTCLTEFYPHVYINGPSTKTHEMGIKLIDDHVEEIIRSIEKYTPQAPDIRYLDLPYKPYDSRTDEVTL
jgi:hypothetical protein